MEKFNTVLDKEGILIKKCKLLLSNHREFARSVEVAFDEVMAGALYRTVWCENIEFFDRWVLTRLAYFGEKPVRAAIAYSLRDGVCKILSSREPEPESCAAAAFALHFNGRINGGERVRIITDMGEFFASVVADTVRLYY